MGKEISSIISDNTVNAWKGLTYSHLLQSDVSSTNNTVNTTVPAISHPDIFTPAHPNKYLSFMSPSVGEAVSNWGEGLILQAGVEIMGWNDGSSGRIIPSPMTMNPCATNALINYFPQLLK